MHAPQFFLWLDDQPQGPLAPAEIRARLQSGALPWATLATPAGTEDWRKLADWRLQIMGEAGASPEVPRSPSPPTLALHRTWRETTGWGHVGWGLLVLALVAGGFGLLALFRGIEDTGLSGLAAALGLAGIGALFIAVDRLTRLLEKN